MNTFSSEGLYAEICRTIRQRRKAKGLSQNALGKKLGMMQRHISEIERGKVMPRLDTLLEILRTLNLDLVLVSGNLVPIVHALMKDQTRKNQKQPAEQSLYAVNDDEEEEEEEEEEENDEF